MSSSLASVPDGPRSAATRPSVDGLPHGLRTLHQADTGKTLARRPCPGVLPLIMEQFDRVRLIATANIYDGGKCVSHTFFTEDGKKKTAGVMFPATFHFGTGEPEAMELIAGRCRVRLKDESEWKEFGQGQTFHVAGNSSFDIEILDTLHYICHFG